MADSISESGHLALILTDEEAAWLLHVVGCAAQVRGWSCGERKSVNTYDLFKALDTPTIRAIREAHRKSLGYDSTTQKFLKEDSK